MKIDFHHHFIPESLGDSKSFPEWSAAHSGEYLQQNSLDKVILSVPFVDSEDLPGDSLAGFCSGANDELKNLIKEKPDQFGGFGTLPFPDVPSCLEEIDRCRSYGFEGYVLFTNRDGIYPSAVDHRELFQKFNDEKLTLFVHPGSVPIVEGGRYPAIRADLEHSQDVSRLISDLLFDDAFELYPDIRYIFGHGGGSFPYQFSRLGKLSYVVVRRGKIRIRWNRVIKDMKSGSIRTVKYMRRFRFDMFESDSPVHKAALETYLNKDQCLFGSNFPFTVEQEDVVAGL